MEKKKYSWKEVKKELSWKMVTVLFCLVFHKKMGLELDLENVLVRFYPH